MGVVESVGVASVSASGNPRLAEHIRKCMARTVIVCNNRGISTEEKNSVFIRSAMMDVREVVKSGDSRPMDEIINEVLNGMN